MTATITKHPTVAEQERAWSEYVAAHKRAQETLSFSDARQAGHAWRRFLNVFLDEATRIQ
jgi:hypothetical protein